jgi:DNA-binding response OmpR family regulator
MYIVIVEDQPEIAANLQEILTNEGHNTKIAADVGAGRTAIRARQPDLVFLDIHLPDGSGLDLLDFADEIKFIVITGTPHEESLNAAFDRGAVAYLVKPFTLQDVLDAIALAAEK